MSCAHLFMDSVHAKMYKKSMTYMYCMYWYVLCVLVHDFIKSYYGRDACNSNSQTHVRFYEAIVIRCPCRLESCFFKFAGYRSSARVNAMSSTRSVGVVPPTKGGHSDPKEAVPRFLIATADAPLSSILRLRATIAFQIQAHSPGMRTSTIACSILAVDYSKHTC